ncbi:hypothetical protein [Sphaerothrix gracilis]
MVILAEISGDRCKKGLSNLTNLDLITLPLKRARYAQNDIHVFQRGSR